MLVFMPEKMNMMCDKLGYLINKYSDAITCVLMVLCTWIFHHIVIMMPLVLLLHLQVWLQIIVLVVFGYIYLKWAFKYISFLATPLKSRLMTVLSNFLVLSTFIYGWVEVVDPDYWIGFVFDIQYYIICGIFGIIYTLCVLRFLQLIYIQLRENKTKEIIKKIVKGIVIVILATIMSLVLGWLMRWLAIGLLSLSVPTWALFVMLIFLGRYIYALVDISGLVFIPLVKMCMFNSRVWLWLSVFGVVATAINNCILFWCVDAPYGWVEILVSLLMMAIYIVRTIKTCMCFIEIPKYELEDGD